ncbi:NAD-dependent epimerase/dehydratase [Corchorus capsularis]|uniref:NAD-dependent epimerase/dehydratase n=1 Tax=Corchorus capsularis TaxID=210143 RepID=A0A1R3IAS8_COCAP|nr:NAD-dependent epimerase/dehydratase [Corchorus capsularis]
MESLRKFKASSMNFKQDKAGGAGFIGYWLVKKLLEKGYTVHATLRDLEDKSKVGLLKSLPGAEIRLVLFEADIYIYIYNPHQFEKAIQGCEFVFHVATPLQHDTQSSQPGFDPGFSMALVLLLDQMFS